MPLVRIAKNTPLSPKISTKIVVNKEEIPTFTSILPKVTVERVRVGLSSKPLIIFPRKCSSCNFFNFKLLREKIAVSEAEKNAEREIKITRRKMLLNILWDSLIPSA
jgi:hypothetical protein